MSSTAFTIPYVFADLAEVHGIASLQHDALILEFRTVDRFVGLLKSRVRQVRLCVDDLEVVKFRRHSFDGRLVIRTRRGGLLDLLPGAHDREVELWCRRPQRAVAEELVRAFRVRRLERQPRG